MKETKLTPAQQRVIDIMKSHDCYVYHSQYFDSQEIVSRIEIVEPPDKSGFVYRHQHLLYFKLSTFIVLLHRGLIEKFAERQYKLTSIS